MLKQSYLQEISPIIARINFWNKKFIPLFSNIKNCVLQKIYASDDGFVTLSLYKPALEKKNLVINLTKKNTGIEFTSAKPITQSKPNSIIQITRKYLLGKKIKNIYASIAPLCIIFEFDIRCYTDEKGKEVEDYPNCLIFDMDSKEPRICLTRFWEEIPSRYLNMHKNYPLGSLFFESFSEWSMECTKTKRRPTFEHGLYCYSILQTNDEFGSNKELETSNNVETNEIIISDKNILDTEELDNQLPIEKKLTLNQAFLLLPTHVRKCAKTRHQFLERRLNRQKQDLPSDEEIKHLIYVSEGLRANLYRWPKDANVWYVPPELIEERKLPLRFTLKAGQKPGDLLSEYFHEVDKITRRREELLKRISISEKALDIFVTILVKAASDLDNNKKEYSSNSSYSKQEIEFLLNKNIPESLKQLCQILDISAVFSEQKKIHLQEIEAKRLPFRSYVSSNKEFIRVAKSASEGDAMLKLMPGNHFWLHILTGEGSHVWLEKPKKGKISQQSIREAAILAIHFSKFSRTKSGDVRIATRQDIEKKKGLAPGKVLVRRCETQTFKYNDEELQLIMATMT